MGNINEVKWREQLSQLSVYYWADYQKAVPSSSIHMEKIGMRRGKTKPLEASLSYYGENLSSAVVS